MAPGTGDFEITLFGPGYGECIVLHVGDGIWILIDSCVDADGTPAALKYLDEIGLDPAQVVDLVVATHWHDDHIRGMAQLVTTCSKAAFCCAAALCKTEFLTAVGTLAASSTSRTSSGLREIHGVITELAERASEPTHALANRRVFVRDSCEIWSLSPDDGVFQSFLGSMDDLLPGMNRTKRRTRSLSPNDVAVVLWVRVRDITVLLGSDLERRGWARILQSRERPPGQASVFKVPHHGSQNADEPDVMAADADIGARRTRHTVAAWVKRTTKQAGRAAYLFVHAEGLRDRQTERAWAQQSRCGGPNPPGIRREAPTNRDGAKRDSAPAVA